MRMHSIMVFQSRQTINRMTVAARVLFLASPNMCTVVLKQKCETTVSMADSYQPGVQLNTSRKPGRNCHNRPTIARCDKSSETQQSWDLFHRDWRSPLKSPSSYMVCDEPFPMAHVVQSCTNVVSPNHLPVIVVSNRPWTTLSTRAH